jgi:GNAT superfamily N-acetyltransferase
MPTYDIRPFVKSDIPQLLEMMRGLAAFEGYLDDFNIDEQILIKWGLCAHPQFHIYVADVGGALLAYAACYEIPFTYDQRPTLALKEMFAVADARGSGAAMDVFLAVKQKALEIGAGRLSWLVLPDNDRAKAFYTKLGAQHDTAWHNWHITF